MAGDAVAKTDQSPRFRNVFFEAETEDKVAEATLARYKVYLGVNIYTKGGKKKLEFFREQLTENLKVTEDLTVVFVRKIVLILTLDSSFWHVRRYGECKSC